MEQIIGKLSEIETTAESIMKDAQQQKKALSAEMERQSKEFDTQLEKQTEEQIKEIRRNLEGEKDKRLSTLRDDTQAALKELDIPGPSWPVPSAYRPACSACCAGRAARSPR